MFLFANDTFLFANDTFLFANDTIARAHAHALVLDGFRLPFGFGLSWLFGSLRRLSCACLVPVLCHTVSCDTVQLFALLLIVS